MRHRGGVPLPPADDLNATAARSGIGMVDMSGLTVDTRRHAHILRALCSSAGTEALQRLSSTNCVQLHRSILRCLGRNVKAPTVTAALGLLFTVRRTVRRAVRRRARASRVLCSQIRQQLFGRIRAIAAAAPRLKAGGGKLSRRTAALHNPHVCAAMCAVLAEDVARQHGEAAACIAAGAVDAVLCMLRKAGRGRANPATLQVQYWALTLLQALLRRACDCAAHATDDCALALFGVFEMYGAIDVDAIDTASAASAAATGFVVFGSARDVGDVVAAACACMQLLRDLVISGSEPDTILRVLISPVCAKSTQATAAVLALCKRCPRMLTHYRLSVEALERFPAHAAVASSASALLFSVWWDIQDSEFVVLANALRLSVAHLSYMRCSDAVAADAAAADAAVECLLRCLAQNCNAYPVFAHRWVTATACDSDGILCVLTHIANMSRVPFSVLQAVIAVTQSLVFAALAPCGNVTRALHHLLQGVTYSSYLDASAKLALQGVVAACQACHKRGRALRRCKAAPADASRLALPVSSAATLS